MFLGGHSLEILNLNIIISDILLIYITSRDTEIKIHS